MCRPVIIHADTTVLEPPPEKLHLPVKPDAPSCETEPLQIAPLFRSRSCRAVLVIVSPSGVTASSRAAHCGHPFRSRSPKRATRQRRLAGRPSR